MHEMIDTPIFQILREEGLLLGARRAVIYMVERRFPDLSVLVKEQTEQMNSEEELNALLLRISLATSKEEAQAVLMDWKKNATSDDTDELE